MLLISKGEVRSKPPTTNRILAKIQCLWYCVEEYGKQINKDRSPIISRNGAPFRVRNVESKREIMEETAIHR